VKHGFHGSMKVIPNFMENDICHAKLLFDIFQEKAPSLMALV